MTSDLLHLLERCRDAVPRRERALHNDLSTAIRMIESSDVPTQEERAISHPVSERVVLTKEEMDGSRSRVLDLLWGAYKDWRAECPDGDDTDFVPMLGSFVAMVFATSQDEWVRRHFPRWCAITRLEIDECRADVAAGHVHEDWL